MNRWCRQPIGVICPDRVIRAEFGDRKGMDFARLGVADLESWMALALLQTIDTHPQPIGVTQTHVCRILRGAVRPA